MSSVVVVLISKFKREILHNRLTFSAHSAGRYPAHGVRRLQKTDQVGITTRAVFSKQ